MRKLFSLVKAPLNAALVVLLLFLQTLAASPLLHSDVHDDASSRDHTCAVTLLSKGQVDADDPCITLEVPPVQVVAFRQDLAPAFSSFFFSVDSSRGPPSLA